MKYVFGILCLIYLLMPNLGVFELLPDALPIVGHLDEFAVTYLMTRSFGFDLRREGRLSFAGMISFIFVGSVALLYLVFPNFSVIEFIPDAVPVAGNLDEIIASLALTYASQTIRGSRREEQPEVIEGEIVERKEGETT